MPTTKYQWRVLVMEHVHTGPRTGTAAQQSRAKQDLLRHAPLPCAGAVLVQPHQAEADGIHNQDVNHCSIHICIIPCAGAKGKRGRAFETLTTVLCGGFEK